MNKFYNIKARSTQYPQKQKKKKVVILEYALSTNLYIDTSYMGDF